MESEIKVETHLEAVARCKEEQRVAKEKMLARNAARMAELKAAGLIHDGETLEDYDDRMAEGKAKGTEDRLVVAKADEEGGFVSLTIPERQARTGGFGGG